MSSRSTCVGWAMAAMLLALCLSAPAGAAAAGFGPLSGAGGCLVASSGGVVPKGSHCTAGKGLVRPRAVAVSPDGADVYVASSREGSAGESSYGSVAILKRDPASGAISETGCLSSDGTDGRDGASGACAPSPSLLGADGVAVSRDGLAVFVTSSLSGSVVAFSRDLASGSLTRLGCFQGRPPLGSPCPPANVFFGSDSVVASTDGKALFIASPTQGSVSTLVAGTLKRPPAGGGEAPIAVGGEPTVAALFGIPGTPYFANPCIAVNGLDGPCAVGVATQGLDALALSPDGMQLYAAAPRSAAIDVFTTQPMGGLVESSCLKVDPPGGLCAASQLMQSPNALGVSPDGRNVYAADHSTNGASVDVLARDASSGALASSSCVEYLPQEKHEEKSEEEEEEKEAPRPPGSCPGVPGLSRVDVVAVSGDGSAVYAIGGGSAVILSRNAATGKLTEASCAANEDSRCSSLPDLGEVSGAAVSPDGRQVYVAAAGNSVVMAFSIGAAVVTARASTTHAGTARVRLECPRGMRRACRGRVELTRAERARFAHGTHRRRISRVLAGASGHFTILPGHRAIVAVRLSRSARRVLLTRRHRRLRVMAVVRADRGAGGSGYGRRVLLSLGRY